MNLRTRLYKSVCRTLSKRNIKVIFQSKSCLSNFFFSCVNTLARPAAKMPWANSRTPFYYIFAPSLFTNFSEVIAILLMEKLNVILKLELVSINCAEINEKRGQ